MTPPATPPVTPPVTGRMIVACAGWALVLLLAQALAVYLLLVQWRAASIRETLEDLSDTLTLMSTRLDREIHRTDSLLTALPTLLDEYTSEGSTNPAAQRILQGQIAHNPMLRNLMVSDPGGRIIAAAVQPTPPFPPTLLAEVKDLNQDGLLIGRPYVSPTSGEWTLAFARRISIPGMGEAFGIAPASLAGMANHVSASLVARGVEIEVTMTDALLLFSVPFDDKLVGIAPSPERDADDAVLSKSGTLQFQPFALKIMTSRRQALAQWRHDAAWMATLSSIIGVLEAIAAVGAITLFSTRRRARIEAELATKKLMASNRRAQEAADARGAFIANMNHELRTPLNAVIGFSEILADELFGPIGNQRYRDYAADIHASGTHLLSLINDIIDFSTIDMGHRKMVLESIPLNAAIEEALRLLKPQVAARSVQIKLTDVEPDDFIQADARGFRQVLLNLLSNAIKFSPTESMIEIRRQRTVDPALLELAIIDQGAGIAEADIDKLGGQFFRTQSATESAVGGAGLGLSISMSLMKLMSGGISIKSRLGEGATMTIQIPRSNPPAVPQKESVSRQSEVFANSNGGRET